MLLRDIAARKYTVAQVVRRVDEILALDDGIEFATNFSAPHPISYLAAYDIWPRRIGNLIQLIPPFVISVYVRSPEWDGWNIVAHDAVVYKSMRGASWIPALPDDTLESAITRFLHV
jgi:hypothetical protein